MNMKVKVEMTPEEMIVAVKCYEELKAYRATGYTPEQVQELHDRHCMECMQIAHYDNDLNSNRGWIPCSERMPECGIMVHVFSVEDDVVHQFNAFMRDDGRWGSFEMNARDCGNKFSTAVAPNIKITHWMPLPEPPEHTL